MEAVYLLLLFASAYLLGRLYSKEGTLINYRHKGLTWKKSILASVLAIGPLNAVVGFILKALALLAGRDLVITTLWGMLVGFASGTVIGLLLFRQKMKSAHSAP